MMTAARASHDDYAQALRKFPVLIWLLCRQSDRECCAAVIVSDSLKGRVRCGSAAYWAITLSLVPLTGAVSLVSAWVLVRNYSYKTRGGHDLPIGEVRRCPRE